MWIRFLDCSLAADTLAKRRKLSGCTSLVNLLIFSEMLALSRLPTLRNSCRPSESTYSHLILWCLQMLYTLWTVAVVLQCHIKSPWLSWSEYSWTSINHNWPWLSVLCRPISLDGNRPAWWMKLGRTWQNVASEQNKRSVYMYTIYEVFTSVWIFIKEMGLIAVPSDNFVETPNCCNDTRAILL